MFLNLVAPINQLGYGVVGLNVLKALVEQGHTVSLFPIGNVEVEKNRSTIELVQKCIQNAAFYTPDAPSIRIWHQNELAMFPGKGKRIGWPIFELDKFDERELHHLGSVDGLFVCSDWAKDVVRANHINVPTSVIPLGVDTTTFYKDEVAAKARPYHTRNKTIFLNVGKWEVRKGHQELLDAFNIAFEPNDPVELWMVNDNPFLKANLGNEQWAIKYISSKNGQNIKILPRVNTHGELRVLFNQVDWGIFPSHAEGWNLEPLEMMACGKPCIATDYSGHTQYMGESNTILVKPTGMVAAHDGIWFHGQGAWCSFSTLELAEAMKRAHGMKVVERETLVNNARETASQFTWANTAAKITEALHAA
jgi:glycosyltransferase involved in cell wall biosynthesis